MPDAGLLATILLLVGLFLLGLEFFIPSFGMILLLALIALIVSFWAACKAWYGTNPLFFWSYILMGGLGVPGSLLGAVWLMQRTSLGRRIILQGPEKKQENRNPLEDLVGEVGESDTMMSPGGMVLVNNGRYHAESIGMIIDPKSPIIVVDVKGNRLVVRPYSKTAEKPPVDSASDDPNLAETVTPGTVRPDLQNDKPEQPSPPENDDQLDFEIPDD
jgi:membrane-bound ClpP family serine protease